MIDKLTPAGLIFSSTFDCVEHTFEPWHEARERCRFTDRDEILATLHRNAELIHRGASMNLALVEQRRIGKTMIVQQFADE